MCLRAGITIENLKIMTYVDVWKILLSFLPKIQQNEEVGERKASKEEIEMIVARM